MLQLLPPVPDLLLVGDRPKVRHVRPGTRVLAGQTTPAILPPLALRDLLEMSYPGAWKECRRLRFNLDQQEQQRKTVWRDGRSVIIPLSGEELSAIVHPSIRAWGSQPQITKSQSTPTIPGLP